MQASKHLCVLNCIGQVGEAGQVTIELMSKSIFRSCKKGTKIDIYTNVQYT